MHTNTEKMHPQKRLERSPESQSRLIGEGHPCTSLYKARQRLGEVDVFSNAQVPTKDNKTSKETEKYGQVEGSK